MFTFSRSPYNYVTFEALLEGADLYFLEPLSSSRLTKGVETYFRRYMINVLGLTRDNMARERTYVYFIEGGGIRYYYFFFLGGGGYI